MHPSAFRLARRAGAVLTASAAIALPGDVLAAVELSDEPVASLSARTAARFEELDKARTRLHFNHPIDDTHTLRYLCASAMCVGGSAVGDFDNDKKPDIFLTNGPGRNKLYRQKGPVKFEDVTAKAGVDGG